MALPPSSRILLLAIIGSAWLIPERATAQQPEFNGRTLAAWTEQLRTDPVPRKRRAAVVALGQIGTQGGNALAEVLPQLGRALRIDAEAQVRRQAALAIIQQKIEDSTPAINDLAESMRSERDPSVKKEVARALARYGRLARPAVQPLTLALQDEDDEVRAASADALGRIGAPAGGSVATLVPLVNDKAQSVRQAAVFALGRIEPEDSGDAAAALVKVLLNEEALEIRREALVSLTLLGNRDTSTIDAVGQQLEAEAAPMRRQAVIALGRFGVAAKSQVDRLKKLAEDDKDALARGYALHSLSQIHGSQTVDLLPFYSQRLKEDPDFEVRVIAAEEIGALGQAAKSAAPALQEARRDQQIKVREAAAQALKRVMMTEKKENDD